MLSYKGIFCGRKVLKRVRLLRLVGNSFIRLRKQGIKDIQEFNTSSGQIGDWFDRSIQ